MSLSPCTPAGCGDIGALCGNRATGSSGQLSCKVTCFSLLEPEKSGFKFCLDSRRLKEEEIQNLVEIIKREVADEVRKVDIL